MDVTVVYSTDGLNKRFGLVTLEDDLHFFPEYIFRNWKNIYMR